MNLSERCAEAYNAIGQYNCCIENQLSPFSMFRAEKTLEKTINSLTKEDWEELKKECPKQYKDLLQYK
jgi:hypothetical protein